MRKVTLFLATIAVGTFAVALQSSAASFVKQFPTLKQYQAESGGLSCKSDIAHKSNHRPTVQITGVITGEGVECTALRGDDGRLYTFAGNAGGFESGDRVRLVGRLAQASFCMQGTTIEVRRIIALR